MSQSWGRCYICTSFWSSCSPKSVFFFFPSFPLFSPLDLGAAVGGERGGFLPCVRGREREGEGGWPHREEVAWGGHIRLGSLFLLWIISSVQILIHYYTMIITPNITYEISNGILSTRSTHPWSLIIHPSSHSKSQLFASFKLLVKLGTLYAFQHINCILIQYVLQRVKLYL